jgi:hypothetical protein
MHGRRPVSELRGLSRRVAEGGRDGLNAARPEELPLLTYYSNSVARLFE